MYTYCCFTYKYDACAKLNYDDDNNDNETEDEVDAYVPVYGRKPTITYNVLDVSNRNRENDEVHIYDWGGHCEYTSTHLIVFIATLWIIGNAR